MRTPEMAALFFGHIGPNGSLKIPLDREEKAKLNGAIFKNY